MPPHWHPASDSTNRRLVLLTWRSRSSTISSWAYKSRDNSTFRSKHVHESRRTITCTAPRLSRLRLILGRSVDCCGTIRVLNDLFQDLTRWRDDEVCLVFGLLLFLLLPWWRHVGFCPKSHRRAGSSWASTSRAATGTRFLAPRTGTPKPLADRHCPRSFFFCRAALRGPSLGRLLHMFTFD